MAISFHCRRIRIQSRPHFINPFQDQTTEQVEWSWLTELQAVLVRDNSCSRSKNTGCVCAPLTFLRSELACVCTPYRCGCVSTSVCVSASRFLPYYWLSAAFRLRFQLCWVTPSFSAPWSLFFFYSFQESGEERSKTLCTDLRSLVYYRRKRVQTTSQKLKPKHIPDHLWPSSFSWPPAFRGRISALYTKLCNQVFRTDGYPTHTLPQAFVPPPKLIRFYQFLAITRVAYCWFCQLLLEFPRLSM